MMRAAVVQGENVVNVIEVESLDQETDFKGWGLIPQDSTLVESDEAGPGWTYADGTFAPPPPPDDLPQPPEG